MGQYPTEVRPFLDRPPPRPMSLSASLPLPSKAPIPRQVTFSGADRSVVPDASLPYVPRGKGPPSKPAPDVSSVSHAWITADREASKWPPGKLLQLAKDVQYAVAFGVADKSLGFPREPLYNQWQWTLKRNDLPEGVCARILEVISVGKSAPVAAPASPSGHTEWGRGDKVKEAHASANATGEADRQAARGSKGGKGEYGGGGFWLPGTERVRARQPNSPHRWHWQGASTVFWGRQTTRSSAI